MGCLIIDNFLVLMKYKTSPSDYASLSDLLKCRIREKKLDLLDGLTNGPVLFLVGNLIVCEGFFFQLQIGVCVML